MAAHITPLPTIMCMAPTLFGPVSCPHLKTRQALGAPLPSGRRYLPFIAYRGTYTPPANFGRPNTAVLCRLLPVLLLGNGHSRHYLRNPRMVVRPCPLASPWCIRPFLPREHRPRLRWQTISAMQLLQRPVSHGCSHSFRFRPHTR